MNVRIDPGCEVIELRPKPLLPLLPYIAVLGSEFCQLRPLLLHDAEQRAALGL